jgi:putative phosphoribosyl transferase
MPFLPPLWRDRSEAGALLATRFPPATALTATHTLLLALPRGGVPVAAAMARHLGYPLATWSVRKVADPSWPELAIGAIAAGGVVVWRDGGQHSALEWEQQARRHGWLQKEEKELARRQALFGDPAPEQLRDRHVLVVDDGIATGMTVRAALLSLRQLRPASLTLAVPVLDRQVAQELRPLVDHLEALAEVENLRAVGLWYREFEQMRDEEVLAILRNAGPRPQ